MAISYKLNKIDADQVVIVNTPLATDAVLALGELTLLDEAGAVALKPLIRDVVGKRKTAYAAGTAEVNTITLTTIALPTAGSASMYKITIQHANVVDASGSPAVEKSYIVSSDTSATVDEIGAAFVTRINNDLFSGVVASYNSGTDVLTLTSASANYGNMTVTNGFNIAVVISTPYVAPSGTYADAAQYLSNNLSLLALSANYTKYLLRVRKLIRHNAVTGLFVYKVVNVLVFADALNGGYAAYAAALDAAVGGTTATAAAYTGTPTI